jgi:bis(5'-nucleosyl)-tetraphosphatase (symmetrical)
VSTWAIGDIQGCFVSFEALLAAIDFQPARDRLWLAGDLVNRGTGSLNMLRWAVAHDDVVTAVQGNHEIGLLQCAAGTRKPRKTDTIAPILSAPDAAELLQWVRQRPLIHVAQGHVLVHAGLFPGWDLATCMRKAAERDSFATQAFTRMRMIGADGTLDMQYAGPPESAPPGTRPWYLARKFEPGTRVLFGHWASLGVRRGDHWQSLDSGCVWGGALTAYNLDTGALVSVNAALRDLQPS